MIEQFPEVNKYIPHKKYMFIKEENGKKRSEIYEYLERNCHKNVKLCRK